MSQVVVIAMTRSGVKILSSKSKDANIECMYATFVRRLDAECDVDVCRSLLSFGKERKISASLPLPSLSTFNNRTSSFTEISWPLVNFSRYSEDMSASCTSYACTRVNLNKHIRLGADLE